MLRRTGVALAVVAATAALTVPPALAAKPVAGRDVKTGGMQGQVPARGAHSAARPSGSALMSLHGGLVMPTAATEAIFWGTSWGNSSFVGDKITGLRDWYKGFGGSPYARTSDEYKGADGAAVTDSVSYLGDVTDTSPAPGNAPSVQTVLAEVNRKVLNPVTNGYYAVYVDTPRGSAGYCAWHSYGTGSDGTTPIQIAFFFNLDGDAGCDPGDTSSGHSQGLAALANVSGHELSEARTDPRNGGWYDQKGNENGDKCAWTFGAPLVSFSNGTQWKIQGEWSNAAYTAGTGYPNRAGQRGCLSGS